VTNLDACTPDRHVDVLDALAELAAAGEPCCPIPFATIAVGAPDADPR
jgi:hypothetical protein